MIDQGILYGREHNQDKESGKDISLDKFESGAKHFVGLLEKHPVSIHKILGYARDYYRGFNRKRRKVERSSHPHATAPLAGSTSMGSKIEMTSDAMKRRVKIAIEASESSSSILGFDQTHPHPPAPPHLRADLLAPPNAIAIPTTPALRPPSRSASATSLAGVLSVQWCWLDVENAWQPYPPATSSLMENSFLAGARIVQIDREHSVGESLPPSLKSSQSTPCIPPSHSHSLPFLFLFFNKIDFETLTQTRNRTNTRRRIKREILHPHFPAPARVELPAAQSKKGRGRKTWKLVGAMTMCFAIRKYAHSQKKSK